MMETITHSYFWLNDSDKVNLQRIPVYVKNIDYLYCMARETLESDKLYLFLPSGDTCIDDRVYWENLETAADLIIYTEEQMQKLSIYFDIRNVSH